MHSSTSFHFPGLTAESVTTGRGVDKRIADSGQNDVMTD